LARFSEQFIRQVAQATDIVDLVSRYVALTRRGKEFVGLCPFHDDHKPSMYVSPSKQIFKCFACGAGGGVFQFMQLYEKLAFPEAVRALAEQAGIPIPREGLSDSSGEICKADLVRVQTFAAKFFRSQLYGPAGKGALEYVRRRGLTDESIRRFGLGYAPESLEVLLAEARRHHITERELAAAGLVVRPEGRGGCYARFRNRLMFPIFDPAGAVVAFGGRAMDESQKAKYLNSPETAAFDKSGLLYALNWARGAIVSAGRAVVVEGYFDALIPIQCGVTNVVATMGTSLTDRHARLLGRYAREVVLVFDADTAGLAAAERALELFLTQRFDVRVASISTGKDPCEYCLAEGPDAFRELLDRSPDALEYVWQRKLQAYRRSGASLADRRQVVEDFLRLVVSSASYGAIDGVRRGQLAQHIGHMLNISSAELQQQMRRIARRLPRGSRAAGAGDFQAERDPAALAERQVLEVLLNRDDLLARAAERIGPEDFTDGRLRRIAEGLWRLAGEGRGRLEELLALENIADCGGLVAELVTMGQRRGNYEQTLEAAVSHIVYARERDELRHLDAKVLSDEELRRLGQRFRSPDPRRHPGLC